MMAEEIFRRCGLLYYRLTLSTWSTLGGLRVPLPAHFLSKRVELVPRQCRFLAVGRINRFQAKVGRPPNVGKTYVN